MTSYTFKWEHPEANEVYVTGTFDDWGKTVKLDRKGDFFEKDVQLPNKDKIRYKFVVNGEWIPNSHLPQEIDEHGNVTNVFHPHQLEEPSTISSAASRFMVLPDGNVRPEDQKTLPTEIMSSRL